MKSSTAKSRAMASTLALASAAIFSVSGVVHAQYGDSSSAQGSSVGQSGSESGSAGQTQPGEASGGVAGKGILKEGMDQGHVEQIKRNERNKDPRSPSPDSHVPAYPRDKEGNIIRDPEHMQGGPLGPN